MGAQSGDLVRAHAGNDPTELFEGRLELSYSSIFDSLAVQVRVGGYLRYVDPGSVRILEKADRLKVSGVGGSATAANDKWLWDLDVALEDGLVRQIGEGQGGEWAQIEQRLLELAEPLVAAGWRQEDLAAESRWEFGDSLSMTLSRDEEILTIELYDHGLVDVFHDLGESDYDGDPKRALVHATKEEDLLAAYRFRGWV